MKLMTDVLHGEVMKSRLDRGYIARCLGIVCKSARNVLLMQLNSRNAEHKFAADDVVPLERVLDTYAGLHFHAQALGHVAIKLPEGECSPEERDRLALQAARDFGALVGEYERATAPGSDQGAELSEAEIEGIRQRGYQAVQRMVNFLVNVCGTDETGSFSFSSSSTA